MGMFLRMLKVFGILLLYMAFLALPIYGGIVWFGGSTVGDLMIIGGSILAGTVGLVFVLDWAMKRVFHFRGEGRPVPEQQLRSEIKALNDLEGPAMAQERDGLLVVTWKYVDARWWELLGKAGLESLYELRIRLRPETHDAVLVDVTRSVSWGAGPSGVRLTGGFFRGLEGEIEIGKQYGIREDLRVGTVYEYSFNPTRIKTPVMNTILRSGWDVRFGLW